jgi:hypothetical protein
MELKLWIIGPKHNEPVYCHKIEPGEEPNTLHCLDKAGDIILILPIENLISIKPVKSL